MAKKRKRSRSASPSRYGSQRGQLQTTPSSSPQPDESAEEIVKGDTPPSRQQTKKVNFADEYRYVYQDLRRIAILAGTILAVLIVLSFVVS